MSSEVQVGYLFSKRNHGTMARSPHLPLPWKKSLLVACFRLFLLAEVGFLSLPFCTTSSFLVVSPKPQSQLKRLGKLLSVHLTFNPIPRSSELVPFWLTWCKLTGRIIPVDSIGGIYHIRRIISPISSLSGKGLSRTRWDDQCSGRPKIGHPQHGKSN